MAEGGGEQQASDTRSGSSDVFISYASQDVLLANSVVETLERNGITCWIAPRDVMPGEFYADAIVHAIDRAPTLVLVLPQSAASSPAVGLAEGLNDGYKV